MGLNKQKGNMYGFITHTWNPIKGRCPHDCIYCYMHRYWDAMDSQAVRAKYPNSPDSKLRLDEKEFKEFDRDMKKYGDSGHFIFIGSSTDMWARRDSILWWGWQSRIKDHIEKYPDNQYLFQTKFPFGYDGWSFNYNNILGITLESNRDIFGFSKAVSPIQRVKDFMKIHHSRKMVTIEPIMDFDVIPFATIIAALEPEWVNIGADSGGHDLPEPNKEKIEELYHKLITFTEVKYKSNLKRLL